MLDFTINIHNIFIMKEPVDACVEVNNFFCNAIFVVWFQEETVNLLTIWVNQNQYDLDPSYGQSLYCLNSFFNFYFALWSSTPPNIFTL